MNFLDEYKDELAKAIDELKLEDFLNLAKIIRNKNKENKIIIAGNGGSAAMASHVCVDLTKAANVRAINFNEADLITCYANDYGYEEWLVKALESYAIKDDIIILISSSGASKNIVNAAKYAIDMDLKLITLSGFSPSNPLRKIGNINFYCSSSKYNIVEMTHHIWLLMLVDFLQEQY